MESDSGLISNSLFETLGENIETFSVTWLDPSVNEMDSVDIQNELRSNIHCVQVFEQLNVCQKYIEEMSPHDRTILITSGGLGKILIPHIHDCLQISAIYIFCMDEDLYKTWSKDFKKIKGVITENDDLITKVNEDHRKQKKMKEPLAYTILQEGSSSQDSSEVLNSPFVYSHLLVDFLMKLERTFVDRAELISFCSNQYYRNTDALGLINRFQYEYLAKKALWWYTCEPFPYRMLDKALRTQNIHLLYLYRFLISDIHEQLLEHQYNERIRTYRAQYLSRDELQIFKDSTEKLISIKSFLSSSSSRSVALECIDDVQPTNSDMKRVLFKIIADPADNTTQPFVNINEFRGCNGEIEILFSMNSVFRINSVHNGSDNTCVIRMTLCDDNDPDLKTITDHVRNKYQSRNINLLLFCELLCEMKKYSEADIYNRYYLQTSSISLLNTSICYDNLARLAFLSDDYESSLSWCKDSLKLKRSVFKPEDSRRAESYFCLGEIYDKQNDHHEASKYFKKAFKIWKSKDNLTDVINCRLKLGRMKAITGKYSSALDHYENVLKLWTKSNVPHSQTDLGNLYFDIGNLHQQLYHPHDEVFKYYNLALESYRNCIPVNDRYMALVFERIATCHQDKEYQMLSLIFFKQAANIYRQILPGNHSDLIQIERTIEIIQLRLKDCIVQQNQPGTM